MEYDLYSEHKCHMTGESPFCCWRNFLNVCITNCKTEQMMIDIQFMESELNIRSLRVMWHAYLLTYLLTYLLNQWCRTWFEKL